MLPIQFPASVLFLSYIVTENKIKFKKATLKCFCVDELAAEIVDFETESVQHAHLYKVL